MPPSFPSSFATMPFTTAGVSYKYALMTPSLSFLQKRTSSSTLTFSILVSLWRTIWYLRLHFHQGRILCTFQFPSIHSIFEHLVKGSGISHTPLNMFSRKSKSASPGTTDSLEQLVASRSGNQRNSLSPAPAPPAKKKTAPAKKPIAGPLASSSGIAKKPRVESSKIGKEKEKKVADAADAMLGLTIAHSPNYREHSTTPPPWTDKSKGPELRDSRSRSRSKSATPPPSPPPRRKPMSRNQKLDFLQQFYTQRRAVGDSRE